MYKLQSQFLLGKMTLQKNKHFRNHQYYFINIDKILFFFF